MNHSLPSGAAPGGKRRAAFIDRDGTILDGGDYPTVIDQLTIFPEAADALKLFRKSGYLCVMITNQSVVARGMLTVQELEAMHEQVRGWLREGGADFDAVYYCPHLPDGQVEEFAVTCDCRKPQPGMLLRAAEDLDIDLASSIMIGDSPRDVEAGNRAGCTTFLIAGERTVELDELEPGQRPDFIVPDILAAAEVASRQ